MIVFVLVYNSILDSWFFEKLQSGSMDNPVEVFLADLEQAGNAIGTKLNPNLTHIYSLASHYIYGEENHETAVEFFELGLDYFPDYLDFYMEIIAIYKASGNQDQVNKWKAALSDKARQSSLLSTSEKEAIFEYLEEN
jgi:hypothetical protein